MLGAARDLGELGGFDDTLGELGGDAPCDPGELTNEFSEDLRLPPVARRFGVRFSGSEVGHTSLGTTGGGCCCLWSSGKVVRVLPASSEESNASCFRSCSKHIERDSMLCASKSTLQSTRSLRAPLISLKGPSRIASSILSHSSSPPLNVL